MNARNIMVSSYHSKVRSAPNKGDTFLFFGTWTLVSFLYAGAQQKLFQGRGSFVELGQLDKYFVKNTHKKRPRKGKFWELLLLLLKLHFG